MENNYAFIDSQNVNLGIRSLGWKLDWRKFRQYLQNKYSVTRAFLFIGFVQNNIRMYNTLENCGYKIILKPTQSLAGGVIKGNVDAELVLHTMINYQEFSKAVIATGDGDFHCLVEYLESKGRLKCLLVPNGHYSNLFHNFNDKIVRIDQLKNSVENKN